MLCLCLNWSWIISLNWSVNSLEWRMINHKWHNYVYLTIRFVVQPCQSHGTNQLTSLRAQKQIDLINSLEVQPANTYTVTHVQGEINLLPSSNRYFRFSHGENFPRNWLVYKCQWKNNVLSIWSGTQKLNKALFHPI